MATNSFGIVRYAPRTGDIPEDDICSMPTPSSRTGAGGSPNGSSPSWSPSRQPCASRLCAPPASVTRPQRLHRPWENFWTALRSSRARLLAGAPAERASADGV